MGKKQSNKKLNGMEPSVTLVKSKAYGEHTRAMRGTYTDITLAEGMKASSSDQTQANLMAKVIFDAVNEFAQGFKDGKFWSRLVSVFRQQKKLGMEYNYDFAGFEVRLDYPLNSHGRFSLSGSGCRVTVNYHFYKNKAYHLSMLRIAAKGSLLTPYPHEIMEFEVQAGETKGLVQFDFSFLPEGTPVLYALKCEQLEKGELSGLLKGKGVRFF